MAFVLIGLAFLGMEIVMVQCSSAQTPAGENGERSAGTVASIEEVAGRWLRPDGGYILELARPSPDEKFKAKYFNPRPIRVATTRVNQEGSVIRVYVEMLDVGYPGSYYDLVYDAEGDRLVGFYFQATMKATFDVFFIRAETQGAEPGSHP